MLFRSERAAVAASRYDDPPASFTKGRWLDFSLLYSDDNQDTVPCKSTADGFQGALISIGPETDAVIDRLGLNDSLIPCLRVLTHTVRSSRWESVLRTPHWGLSYEQAANFAKAMQADISGRQNQDLQVFPLFSMNSMDGLLIGLGLHVIRSQVRLSTFICHSNCRHLSFLLLGDLHQIP